MQCSLSRVALAVGAIWSSLLPALGCKDSPAAESPVLPVPEGAGSTFSFQGRADATDEAIDELYQTFMARPTSAEQWAALDDRAAAARQAIRADGAEVTDRLLLELDAVAATNERARRILFHLLAEASTERGFDYLTGVATMTLPEATALEESHEPSRDRDFLLMVRHHAVSELARMAMSGEALAKDRLLTIVETGDRLIRPPAIAAYYAASLERWRAKRVMKTRLPPSAHYLLNRVD